MIALTISDNTRELRSRKDLEEHWVVQLLQGHRGDGRRPCIKLDVKGQGIDLIFTWGSCRGGSGGGGLAEVSARQRGMIDIWNKHMDGRDEVSPGVIISLVQETFRYLS